MFKQIFSSDFEAVKRRQTRSDGLNTCDRFHESFTSVNDVLAHRARDGQILFALKSEQNVSAKGDLDISVDIWIENLDHLICQLRRALQR